MNSEPGTIITLSVMACIAVFGICRLIVCLIFTEKQAAKKRELNHTASRQQYYDEIYKRTKFKEEPLILPEKRPPSKKFDSEGKII